MLRGTTTKGHLALHSSLRATSDISQLINLLELGECPCTSASRSCFAIAIENSEWDKLKLLLDHTPTGVNISAGYKRVTALMKFGHIPEATQYLLFIGANVNAEDIHGECALSYVIRHKDTNPEVVKMLIDAGANVNTRFPILSQFLHHHDDVNVQIFTMMLTAGAKVETSNINHFILYQNPVNLEIVKAFIKAPPDLNVQKSIKNKILIGAAKAENLHLVKMMIDAGADVNYQEDSLKYSALMYAIAAPSIKMMKVLIKAGTDMNSQDKNGCSIMMLAIKYQAENLVHIVQMLLRKKADPCLTDNSGCSALMYAVQHQEHALPLLKALLKSGAPINNRKNNGESALILAVREDTIMNPQVVKILINAHADVNVQNSDGDSPLMLAVKNKNVTLKVVRMFTKAGALVLAENNERQTVLSAIIDSCKWQPKKKFLVILKHLLQLPELKHVVYAPHTNHPQQVLLKTACNETNMLKETLFEIFELIVNSQFKDTVYLELSLLVNVPVLFQNINIPFGAVALLLNKCLYPDHVLALMNYVNVLLEAGFNMREGVSPLTVFLRNLICGRHGNVEITDAEQAQVAEPHPVSHFIDFLIEHGAHVGQQMLKTLHSKFVRHQDLRGQLYVPDSLLEALKSGNVRAVRQLLPYWGFPGLYLLLFTSKYGDTNYLYRLFPVLIEHGGVPQGTELYRKLRQHLALQSHQCPLYLETFERMHSSPLSLRELCRYQVRASLAAQASHAGHNLPALVRELSPPGLKEFLLMQPPADLGLLVCDNLLLVEAAKWAVQCKCVHCVLHNDMMHTEEDLDYDVHDDDFDIGAFIWE